MLIFLDLTSSCRLLGTPTEETWTGLTQLPDYKVM